ncbi:hypothetical protein RHSIM_Rhsim08G0204700 [Rhododendron simsii]|uniref:Uncharacterized protein n=1 Tax=Rhododendron simsii TaxID=118357 RepID=A0A834LJF8_RHOSS|nr:hypothetical protein RHSIM_Rhsim08G0204700 [Rhododendron simsii]
MQILTKMLRWGKQRHSAFSSQAEIDQLLSLNICTFCYTVALEEIAMMISEIDSDGNAHIDLNVIVWIEKNCGIFLMPGYAHSL